MKHESATADDPTRMSNGWKVFDKDETKKYIGITANEFKQRYRNHSKSLCDVTIYSNETELSKYIWKFSGGFRVRQTRQATKVKRFD